MSKKRKTLEMPEPKGPGDVVWHSSEEGGRPDVGYHIGLPGGASLWIGEVARAEWDDFDEDEQALGNDGGWWMIVYAADGRRHVLGRSPSWPIVCEAVDALAAALRGGI